jgi:ketosteroid isomerase-like protein
MKIIISLFASAFVATMAIAQEESASPAETTAPATEEKASATVESTPAAETAPAEAQKKQEPTSAAPAKATGTQKKEEPMAAKPAAATAAAAAAAKTTGKNMSVKDMENAWEAAVAKHDVATVEGFLAADFTGVSMKNKFIGRSDELGEFKKDKDTYKSAKNEKLNVKMYGSNVAVVTGRAREIGTGKDGKAFDRTFLFTDTWMMRGGKWQCIASQVTKIKG